MISNREDLSALAIFVAVATHRSFRRAAGELGVSASALSHAMRDLEARLGQRLLHRTTRRVGPTEAGERLLRRLRPTFRDISTALSELDLGADAPVQRLRLSASPQAADLVLAPLLASTVQENPQLHLEIVTQTGPGELIAERFRCRYPSWRTRDARSDGHPLRPAPALGCGRIAGIPGGPSGAADPA